MTSTTLIIMLAGSLRPPAFRTQIGMPRLCLPLDERHTVLDRWSSAMRSLMPSFEVRIVVNGESPKHQLDAFLRHADHMSEPHRSFRVVVEPASWRGPAGILADVSSDCEDDAIVLGLEANSVAPQSVQPVIDAMTDDITATVGATRNNAPNGLFAFRRRAFEHVPSVGFFDLKEQLLPLMNQRGERVRAVYFDQPTLRIRDRATYLTAVQHAIGVPTDERVEPEVARASIDKSVQIIGSCIIEPGVTIESGAVVHDSVVMRGSCISRGAVVSRSVLAPGALVEPEGRVVREVVPGPSLLLSQYREVARAQTFEAERWRQPA